MAWLTGIWKRMIQRRRDLGLREPANELPPVEHLEARLCLGSMHAASVADWVDTTNDDLSLANEVLLDNRLEQISASLADDGSERVDLDGDRAEPSPENTPAPPPDLYPANIPPGPTSPDLENALQLEALSGLNQPDASATGAAESGTSELARHDSDSAVAVTAVASRTNGEGQSAAGDADIDGSVAGSSQASAMNPWSAEALRPLGWTLDDQGSAVGTAESAARSGYSAWWTAADEPVVVRYDFRDQNGVANTITEQQKALTVEALRRWSEATGGIIVFEQDTQAPASQIINIGSGDLKAFGHVSGEGGVLGVGGGRVYLNEEGNFVASGVAWLDQAERWDNTIGNGNPPSTVDFATVVAHEIGHTLGYGDASGRNDVNIMVGKYSAEQLPSAIGNAVQDGSFYRTIEDPVNAENPFEVKAMTVAAAQLSATEVEQLLKRGAAATSSNDAIIAVVDRFGRVLGVRVEADALAALPAPDTLVFAIDGAIAKARTAALFSNGNPQNGTLAPLTSRTIRFLSQSTVTQREVESNPNVDNASAATAAASTTRGPGFVAPIGVGGHFPPDIPFTPLVDLFGIEHTNRDSNDHPGPDGVRGTADDFRLRTDGGLPAVERGRFNIDPAFVPAGNGLFAPESWGHAQNSGDLTDAQSRGIATLPGGIPLFRDTNGDGRGDTMIGGIGVFFPGPDGFATHEQGFAPGTGQTTLERTNAARVLEAEYIAFAAAGGSLTAQQDFGVPGAKIGTINGVAPVANLDLPFGRLDLVGITLEVYGPMAGKWGVMKLVQRGDAIGEGNPNSGMDQDFANGDTYRAGMAVPGDDTNGAFLVTPHGSAVDDLTTADVRRIIDQGIIAANEVRAAVRLPLSSRTRMVFAVTDTTGEVLGVFRMRDATTFSIDVAVAKARNVAYYADPSDLESVDQVVTAGTAFTNRTFRFLAQPRYPSGIDGTPPPDFSILNDDSIDNLTAENDGAAAPVSAFGSVLGHDAFFPMTNFRDPGDPTVMAAAGAEPTANQNGIVFFPGSTPLYKNGKLVGGLGVSGDGVDQDDVVTFIASLGFQATGVATRADEVFVDGVRLPYQKFLRNPFG